jgi:N-acetylglucosamine-6-phosphate deacetylase
MLRAKTLQRAILVSDLVMLAGLAAGEYDTPIGGRVELHADGRLNVAGTNYLAGATTALKDAIAFVATQTEFGLGDAVQMATENPARFSGVEDGRGVLRVGAPADLVRFQWEPDCRALDVVDVLVLGERAQ